jgi:hypothetical protein
VVAPARSAAGCGEQRLETGRGRVWLERELADGEAQRATLAGAGGRAHGLDLPPDVLLEQPRLERIERVVTWLRAARLAELATRRILAVSAGSFSKIATSRRRSTSSSWHARTTSSATAGMLGSVGHARMRVCNAASMCAPVCGSRSERCNAQTAGEGLRRTRDPGMERVRSRVYGALG